MSAAGTTTTMRAVVSRTYGSPDVLALEDVPRPVPADGQVLVRVRAAGVNPLDWHYLRGAPSVMRVVEPTFGRRGARQPVRGAEVAGVVEAVGPGVAGLRPGDEVMGGVDAAWAELVCADESAFVPKPAGLTFEQAAVIPLAGCTALQGLRDVGKLTAGQSVLINGASGGVGTFAVQIARSMGAEVTAVCSARNVDLVRSLGADHVVDYEAEDPLDTATQYDVVIDNAGGVRIKDWRRVVRRGGAILPNSGVRGPDGGALMRVAKAQWHRLVAPQRVLTVVSSASPQALEEVGQHLASGRFRPLIDTMFTLDHAPEALARVGTHHARGKVIITMPSEATP